MKRESRSSFEWKVHLLTQILINTHFSTTRGRTPRQTVINNDIFILEKHYSGRVPMNMDSESKKFQKIISDFNTAHADNRDRKFKSVNPEKELLVKHGIVYPPMHSGLPVPQWTTPPAASGSLYCDQSGRWYFIGCKFSSSEKTLSFPVNWNSWMRTFKCTSCLQM